MSEALASGAGAGEVPRRWSSSRAATRASSTTPTGCRRRRTVTWSGPTRPGYVQGWDARAGRPGGDGARAPAATASRTWSIRRRGAWCWRRPGDAGRAGRRAAGDALPRRGPPGRRRWRCSKGRARSATTPPAPLPLVLEDRWKEPHAMNDPLDQSRANASAAAACRRPAADAPVRGGWPSPPASCCSAVPACLLGGALGPAAGRLSASFCFFGLVARLLRQPAGGQLAHHRLGHRPATRCWPCWCCKVRRRSTAAFEAAGDVVKQFIGFSDEGAEFVFGNLADARPPIGGTWSRCSAPSYVFHVRLRRPAADPVRLGVLHRAVPLRRPAVVRPAAGPGDGLPDGHQRGRDAVGGGQRLHGPDRGAADRQAVRAADDQLGAVRADGQRHGPHLRRHDGGLHQLRRRPGRRPGHVRHGLPVQPVPGQAVPAGDRARRRPRGTVQHARRRSRPTSTPSTPPPPAPPTGCGWRSTSPPC